MNTIQLRADGRVLSEEEEARIEAAREAALISIWLEKNQAGRIRTGVVWADQPAPRSSWPLVGLAVLIVIFAIKGLNL